MPVRAPTKTDAYARNATNSINDCPKPVETARQLLIDGLNKDLAGEYQAIVMYIQYSAKLTGPYRRELCALFQAEIADEQGHAQFLADKIASLGGEPTTEPRGVPHADQPREMLQHVLAAEKQAIADYTERLQQAEASGEVGLKVSLENQIADETRHREELERVLAGWDDAEIKPREPMAVLTFSASCFSCHTFYSGERIMLRLAIVFLVIALIAAFLGFGGVAALSWGGAKILFVIFLILAVVSFLANGHRRGSYWGG